MLRLFFKYAPNILGYLKKSLFDSVFKSLLLFDGINLLFCSQLLKFYYYFKLKIRYKVTKRFYCHCFNPFI